MTRHVVMFSGGAGSWAAAKRVAARYGTALRQFRMRLEGNPAAFDPNDVGGCGCALGDQ